MKESSHPQTESSSKIGVSLAGKEEKKMESMPNNPSSMWTANANEMMQGRLSQISLGEHCNRMIIKDVSTSHDTQDAQDAQDAQENNSFSMNKSNIQMEVLNEDGMAPLMRNHSAHTDLKSPVPFHRNASSNLHVPCFLPVLSRNQIEMTPFFDTSDGRLSPDLIMCRSPSTMQFGFTMSPIPIDA